MRLFNTQRSYEENILRVELCKAEMRIMQLEDSLNNAYAKGYSDGREDQALAMRDAAHVVEELLKEYPYDSEGYRAITTAGNRLRILASTEE